MNVALILLGILGILFTLFAGVTALLYSTGEDLSEAAIIAFGVVGGTTLFVGGITGFALLIVAGAS